MERVALGFYTFAERATRLVYLNLLWIAFTIVGLGILGIMPATTAMFAVARKWIMRETNIPIFKTFWDTYRKEFFKTNGIGLVFFALIYILVIQFNILFFHEQLVYNIAAFGIIAIFILLTIVLTYFFPIYVHFNLKTSDYLKWPLIIGIIHPILTIVLIVGLAFLYYLVYSILPQILYFFAGSVGAYLITLGSSQTFQKYEEKKE